MYEVRRSPCPCHSDVIGGFDNGWLAVVVEGSMPFATKIRKLDIGGLESGGLLLLGYKK